jgi:uncharacterized protein (DUF488 family)
MNIFTIGFAQKSAEDFFRLLVSSKVERLIDVRLNNKSQLAGFANRKHLPYFLKIHGIGYFYKPELAPTKQLLDDYKKHKVTWEQYELEYKKILLKREISKVIDWQLFNNSVLLCSEPSAEKCHRRLLAEYLAELRKNISIIHL